MKSINDTNPFLEINTERLLLREIGNQDVNAVFRLRSDEEMMKYIPRPRCKNKRDALKLIRLIRQGISKQDSINWGINLKGNDTLIGTVGFVRMHREHNRAEVGYMLDKEFHGKGIMQEAVSAILNFGFSNLKLHSVEAVIDPGNHASEQILIKFGFIKEAHFKENFLFEGKYLDSVHYTLHQNDWKNKLK